MVKYGEILNLIGFMAIVSLLLLMAFPVVDASGFAETHGNAQFIKYIIKQKSDGYRNTLKVVVNIYLDPDYPRSSYNAAVLYLTKVYQSPADHDKWGVKDGNYEHHTVTIRMYNPRSGNSESLINEYLPETLIREEYGGTVTYGFAISGGSSTQVTGGEACLNAESYVSWTIPVYHYKLKPLRMTNEEFKLAADITGEYDMARTYTAGVSVPYVSFGVQSIQIYTEGRFHQWKLFGPDSTIRLSLTASFGGDKVPI